MKASERSGHETASSSRGDVRDVDVIPWNKDKLARK